MTSFPTMFCHFIDKESDISLVKNKEVGGGVEECPYQVESLNTREYLNNFQTDFTNYDINGVL